MRRRSRAELEALAQKERHFQEVQDHYYSTGDIRDWNEMFLAIYDCCFNICKQRLSNLGLDPERIQQTALDSACYAVEMIMKKGHKPVKLSSYCWSYCTYYILNKRTQWEDQNLRRMGDYDETTEEEITSYRSRSESFEEELVERLSAEGY